MRELCNTREPYQALLAGKELRCLPEQMAALGYRTISLHNFTSAFFGRDQWYPKLGFERRLFASDLAGTVQRLCGGPFRGPCDVDVVPFIARQLRQADKPTLFYWMTLSTHVPIAPGEGTPRLGCEPNGGRIGHVEVCYMTEMWIDLSEAIARLALELPDTEILLVGDHAPPLWSRAGRARFTPGQVTWLRLSPLGRVPQVTRLPRGSP
jgi:phosphoglycerol transferase MdoB-like AlkP superfamily enzyme